MVVDLLLLFVDSETELSAVLSIVVSVAVVIVSETDSEKPSELLNVVCCVSIASEEEKTEPSVELLTVSVVSKLHLLIHKNKSKPKIVANNTTTITMVNPLFLIMAYLQVH